MTRSEQINNITIVIFFICSLYFLITNSLHIFDYFILQLLANPATGELLSRGIHKTLDSVFLSIDIKKEDKELGGDRYRGVIRSRVLKKLEEIKTCEGLIKGTKLVTSLEYLLKNRSSDNSEIIQYLLDPRRCGRGWGKCLMTTDVSDFSFLELLEYPLLFDGILQ